MNRKDILGLLIASPFEPFRIHLTGGKTFDVKDPDSAFVGPTRLTLITTPAGSKHEEERINFIGLLNIVRIEPLKQAA
jgi:hypothetical protein